MKGDEIVRLCDWHSNKTVTLRKHVTKYKIVQNCIVKYLRKFKNHGNKIARVYIVMSISSDFQLFALTLNDVGGPL